MRNDSAPVAARTKVDRAAIDDSANLHVQVTGATKRFPPVAASAGLDLSASPRSGSASSWSLRGYDSAAGWFAVSTAVVLR